MEMMKAAQIKTSKEKKLSKVYEEASKVYEVEVKKRGI